MRDRPRTPKADQPTPEATTVLGAIKCKLCGEALLIPNPLPIVGDPTPDNTAFIMKFLGLDPTGRQLSNSIMKHMNDAHIDLMVPSTQLAARFSHFLILQQFDLKADPLMQEQYDLRRLQLLRIIPATPDDAALAQQLTAKGFKLDVGLPVNESGLVKP